jgi:hypothetical protein
MNALLERDQKIKQLIVVMNILSDGSMPMDEWHRFVDCAEALLVDGPQIDPKMEHTLLDGMYIRRIYLPEGSYAISKIHNTEHPFVILKGKVLVRSNFGVRLYKAPFRGITKPGTRRVLLMLEDVVWETYHPTNLKSVTEIMDAILDHRQNPLLTEEQIQKLNSFQQKTNLLN